MGGGGRGRKQKPPSRDGQERLAGGLGCQNLRGLFGFPKDASWEPFPNTSSEGCPVQDVCDKNVSFMHHCWSPVCKHRASYTRGACLLKEELNLALLITKKLRFYIDFLSFFLF